MTDHNLARPALMGRVLRVGGSFAAVVAAYCLYAVAAVPWIEPSVTRVEGGDATRHDGARDLTSEEIRLISPLFSDGAWERGNPKVLKIDQLRLVMQDYHVLGDGSVEITPCTIVLTPGKPGDDEAERIRQAIVLQAPGGAVMRFDKPFNLRRADIGRLVAGQLRGDITIRSRGKKPGDPDLLVTTRDVQLNERDVTTPHPVDFRWGQSFGRGRQMLIKLLPGDPATVARRRGPNIGGVESFEVSHVERLHLDLGKVRWSPDDGAAAASGTGGGKTSDLPLEVACSGPFRFDAVKQVATFHNQVSVWRINPDRTRDQLNCELLSIYFVERSKLQAGAQAAAAPSSGPGATGLAPQRIEARGTPVVLTAPSEHAYACGQRMEYDFQINRIALEAADEAVLKQDDNEIHARTLQYQSAGPGRVGLVVSDGPGWLRGQTTDRPDQQLEARWKGQLRVRPHAQNQLISLTGGANLKFRGFGELDAKEIYFWMLESPPGATPSQPAQPRLVPDRMLARDEVHIDSAQLAAAIDRMEVWFERAGGLPGAVAGGASPRVGSPFGGAAVPVVRAGETPGPQLGLGQALVGGPPAAAATLPAADASGQAPGAIPAPPQQQHFDVLGAVLRARVLLRENQQSELCELMVEDRVRFMETQTAQPGERPLLVTGDRLHVVEAGQPHAAVTVTGGPAHFEGRGLALTGPNINLNRGTNRLLIDGPGQAELPMDRDLENRPLKRPGVLNVDWRERMTFDGRTVLFEGAVTASTTGNGSPTAALAGETGQQPGAEGNSTQELHTETLEVQLRQPINFADASLRHQEPQPEQILCRGGALMESRSYGLKGQISHERMQVADMAVNVVNGALTAGGPGWVTSVRVGPVPSLGPAPGLASGAAAGSPHARTIAVGREAGRDAQSRASGDANGADEMRGMHVRFQGSIIGNLRQHALTFRERVHAAYGPVESWDAVLPLDNPEALGPHGVLLHCDELSAREMTAALGNRKAMEMEAKGNTIAEGIAFTARALRMTYDEAKDLLILEGDGRTDAQLFRQQRVGGDTSQAAARKILYWPKTNKLWIEGARAVDLSRVPTGRPRP